MALDTRHVLVAPTMIYERSTLKIDEKTKFSTGYGEGRKRSNVTEKMTNDVYRCNINNNE